MVALPFVAAVESGAEVHVLKEELVEVGEQPRLLRDLERAPLVLEPDLGHVRAQVPARLQRGLQRGRPRQGAAEEQQQTSPQGNRAPQPAHRQRPDPSGGLVRTPLTADVASQPALVVTSRRMGSGHTGRGPA